MYEDPVVEISKEDWYTDEQQYSYPRIDFESDCKENRFAICNLGDKKLEFA